MPDIKDLKLELKSKSKPKPEPPKEYKLNDIFEKDYPLEAVYWANKHGYIIKAIEPLEGINRYQIQEAPKPTPEEIKRDKIAELEHYLADTDWFATRYAETGKPIPPEVAAKRQAARDEISRLRGDHV